MDDGSRDLTLFAAHAAAASDSRVRVVALARNYGQAIAMQAGFDHAQGETIVSMDGDLQNDPRDIPRLVDKLAEGYDLVTGFREHRKDRLFTRKLPSWAANRMIRWLTGVPIRDNGCSLKAYRRHVLERISLYADMHRFIPAIAASVAAARVTEIPVRHHARRFGKSKYGLNRVAKVLADLLTVGMIRSFRERPLVLFSAAGLVALLPNLTLLLALAITPPALAASWSWVVLSGVALCFLGLSGFLVMLGLIAESVLGAHFQPGALHRPILHENDA